MIAFEGEILNISALRGELEKAGGAFETSDHTEVLVEALEAWGIKKAVEKIVGVFAIAAYDRDERKLYLTRDRLGIRSCYFSERNGVVFFAASPAALIEGIGAESGWKLNWEALYEFFLLGATGRDDSLISGIHKVGPAEIVSFGPDGNFERRIYWTPRRNSNAIAETMIEVVECHRPSGTEVAILLNGGIESSALALMLNGADCFHLESGEAEMAREVADSANAELRHCDLKESFDPDAIHREYVLATGEPAADALIPCLASKALVSADRRIVFHGNGSDALFLGNPRIAAPIPNRSFHPGNGYDISSAGSLSEQLRHLFRCPENFFIPEATQTTRDFAEISRSVEAAFQLPEFPQSASYRWVELQTGVVPGSNAVLDHAGKTHGLEFRMPFLDHRLVETALSADTESLITSRYGRKGPLKAFLDSRGVHPRIWARPEVDFSLPPTMEESLRNRRVRSLSRLSQAGFLQIDVRYGNIYRDFQLLGAAAHAFEIWKEEWIDTGIVNP